MATPMQPLRLPITADLALMNPQAPILAFKVKGFFYRFSPLIKYAILITLIFRWQKSGILF
jgi:hypothetical protein